MEYRGFPRSRHRSSMRSASCSPRTSRPTATCRHFATPQWMGTRSAQMVPLASACRARVRVRSRPRVAVFSPCDEIVDLDAPLERGQIRDSNRYTLASAVRAAGADAWVRGIVPDSPDALRTALREGLAADAIVTSGGVSGGDHDHLKPVRAELGTVEFLAIAIRPGRPLAFGELTD